MAATTQERARLDREIARLVGLLKDGLDSLAVRAELRTLEQRKAALPTGLVRRPVVMPDVDVAALYREKVTGLREALAQEDGRPEAVNLVRGLVDEIRLTPDDTGALLTIAVKGSLAGVLAAAGLPAASCDGCGGSQLL